MNNPDIVTTFADPSPTDSPLNLNELITLLKRLVSSEIVPIPPVPGAPILRMFYIWQHDAPGPEHHDKLWIELDSANRPIAVKLWVNGGTHAAWRRVYNGMLNEVRGFFGVPGYSSAPGSNFDENGTGQIGGLYDGWQICNGRNGSPDLSNQFILGANMLDATGVIGGYGDHGWQAKVKVNNVDTTQNTGGAFEQTLAINQTPRPARAETSAYRWHATGNAGGDSGDQMLGLIPDNPDHRFKYTLLEADPGNPAPVTPPTPPNVLVPVPTTPPFYVLAWIIFRGY